MPAPILYVECRHFISNNQRRVSCMTVTSLLLDDIHSIGFSLPCVVEGFVGENRPRTLQVLVRLNALWALTAKGT